MQLCNRYFIGGIMKTRTVFVIITVLITYLFPSQGNAATAVKDKIAVLITDWGMPSGYNFEYAWNSHTMARFGDWTQYPGQPCKFGHVGEFPHQLHMGLMPWLFAASWPGSATVYDNSGIYRFENGVYISINPNLPSITPDMIPQDVPITPASEIRSGMTGELSYPPDPRTGEDLLPGWYKIGSSSVPLPNGAGDIYEGSCLTFMRYYAVMGGPTSPPEAYLPDAIAEAIMNTTKMMLEDSFGDRIDVRFGMYNKVTGYTELETDVAEQFAREGFKKLLLARETTDHNRYANEFFTLNYVKERLCEIGVLDEMELYQTRQVGRTPEFNAMNIANLRQYIEAYPAGSKIAFVYITRGLPWGSTESTGHPWSKEVYHENAYLNYLSWKKALQSAFGGKYELIFSKGNKNSDLLEDNFYCYGLYVGANLGGHFKSIRDAIQAIKADGVDKIILAPCHWYFDNFDNIMVMRELNNIPIVPKADLEARRYALTYCEDAEGNQVNCEHTNAVATLTVAPSYSGVGELFAKAYYVVLRGTIERFNLFPKETKIVIAVSQPILKSEGGIVEVSHGLSPIKGSRIEIPADPYPDRPESFTPKTAIPINDPRDTNDCMWEDTVINIGHQINPPRMKGTRAVGPAVHFGPYRMFFNRDVTISIPYKPMLALEGQVKAYIYNHVTNDWDAIEPEQAANGIVTFKTQVLGLFRAGVKN